MTKNIEDYSLELKLIRETSFDPYNVCDSFFHITVTLFYTEEDSEEKIKVGYLSAMQVGPEDEHTSTHCDNESQELFDAYNFTETLPKGDLENKKNFGFIYIAHIDIQKNHRGNGLGLLMIKELYSGTIDSTGLYLLKPYPTNPIDDCSKEEEDKYFSDNVESLERYYSKANFKKINDHMIISSSLD